MYKLVQSKGSVFRVCPVCGESTDIDIISTVYCGDTVPYLPVKYGVAMCKHCGMIYANTSAADKDYDRYYCEANFYGNGVQLQNAESHHQQIFMGTIKMMIQEAANSDATILDIGCGNGETLKMLKELGYQNLKGIDPSRESVDHLRNLAIDGAQKSVYDEVSSDDRNRFDFIILQSVLEHLLRPKDAVSNLMKYLKPDGKVFIVVPSFDEIQDFQNEVSANFNVEHINYFTTASLQNLMLQFGMNLLLQQSTLSPQETGGAVYAIFAKGRGYRELQRTTENYRELQRTTENYRELQRTTENYINLQRQKLENYFHNSRQKEDCLRKQIQMLIDKNTKCVIWGAGARTRHLFASTSVKNANIYAIVDNNYDKWGSRIGSFPVSSPDRIISNGKDLLFLICVNFVWVAEEIRQQIIRKLPEAEILII